MPTLLVINATRTDVMERSIAAGDSPRKDYLELKRALDADLIDVGSLDQRRWTRMLRRVLGPTVTQGLLAWVLSPQYDAVFVDRETAGFVVAALSRLRRRRTRLVMIGHLLSPRKKQILFRGLRLRSTIDCMIVHSTLQRRIAEDQMGLLPEQVALVPYQADDRFWAPRPAYENYRICSAGLEYRDYATLVEAVKELDIAVTVAASSHWSKHQADTDAQSAPNVSVESFDYGGLRDLYAGSRFVVVPLLDVENQAGITTILEAMAMGKAVIVSHTRGQTDVVRDRRRRSRVDSTRATQSDWASRLGAEGGVACEQTGIYVTPGDARELRRAITYLLHHPEEAREMGRNGRRLVQSVMSLDDFTRRLTMLISGASSIRDRDEPVPELAGTSL